MNQVQASQRPIGVFDSGVGGLTVMKELLKHLPNENFIYFGDTARLPYGEKSRDTIVRYSMENTSFLLEKGIKMLIVACNTASAYALDHLLEQFSLPIVGVIQPSTEKALQTTRNGRIAVLGTKGTILSRVYQKSFQENSPEIKLFPIACPLLVPLVEENYSSHPATQLILQEYLKSLQENDVDTVLLGCTHYPLLKESIQNILGPDVNIIDSAAACAERISKILGELGLNNLSNSPSVSHYFVSDDPHKFQKLGQSLLDLPIPYVHQVRTIDHAATFASI